MGIARITLLPDFQSWITEATNEAFLTVLAVDLDVILTQRNLPESFHADPADRLIAATSMLSDCPLLTHDQRIRNSGVCKIWDPDH